MASQDGSSLASLGSDVEVAVEKKEEAVQDHVVQRQGGRSSASGVLCLSDVESVIGQIGCAIGGAQAVPWAMAEVRNLIPFVCSRLCVTFVLKK
ncbi:hypothetical protein PVAP13_2KG217816 [Panicum virgatum]|uniref:Uncharacterized protein n=1 Tax=Panicum virgatum TaxID=38727 RepID=A0A8T0WB83_PANVG|nr:hypothetical protein PVAP13_2KG217816 [Panicum virgatum]